MKGPSLRATPAGRQEAFIGCLLLALLAAPLGAAPLLVQVEELTESSGAEDLENPIAIGRFTVEDLTSTQVILIDDPRFDKIQVTPPPSGDARRFVTLRLQGGPNVGNAYVDLGKQTMHGRFTIDAQSFGISPLGQREQAIYAIEDVVDKVEPNPACPSKPQISNDDISCHLGESAAELVVLLAFTPAAIALVENASYQHHKELTTIVVNHANGILRDSGVGARIVDAPTMVLTGFTETHYGLLDQLEKAEAKLRTARSDHDADLVFLIVANGDGAIVRQIMADENCAFAVIQARALQKSYAFVHELSHLLGGSHYDDQDPTVPKGKGYAVANTLRTMMANATNCDACGNGCCFLSLFSNPRISHGNHVLGDKDRFDNACVMTHHAHEVAKR